MNDEAFADAYRLFTGDGYGGSPEEFYTLMNDNEDARNDALEMFRKNGYHGDMSSFEGLLGVNQLAPELQERADNLFGPRPEVSGLTLGGRDSGWGAAGADALQDRGIESQELKEETVFESDARYLDPDLPITEKENELLQGDFTPWLEAWKKEHRPGGEHVPRDLYVRLEAEFKEKKKALLAEFPAMKKKKSEHDKIFLGGAKFEDNIFKGLEFDAKAIELGEHYDTKYFREWIRDASSSEGKSKIRQYAEERLEKNGPTEGMTNWAKDKYGYTAKDEIIEAVEMDPTSPWGEYFYPMRSFTQTYKTGPDTREWLQKEESHWETEQATESGEMIHPDRQRRRTKIIDKKGILNPNFQKTLYFDPNDPEASTRGTETRIEDEVWDNLSTAQKKERIMLGEGDPWQIEEVNNKYGDGVAVLEGKRNSIDKDLSGKKLDLNFQASSVEDLSNLYTFFTGESVNDAYVEPGFWGKISSSDYLDFQGSMSLERFIDDPFVKASNKTSTGRHGEWRPLERNKIIQDDFENKRIEKDLAGWWEEYQKKPLVQAYIVAQDQRGNQIEYEKLLEKVDGDEHVLLKNINKEIMSLPEMKWGYQGINTAQNQIKEFKRQKKEDRYKMDYMGDEYIDEQIEYWENWKDELATEWGYGDDAFDEEGMYIQDFEAKSDIPEGAYTGPGSMWYEEEVVGTHGTPQEILKSYNNDKDRLGEAIVHKRAELQRLINLGAKSTAGMGSDRGNVQKLVAGISDYINPNNETWHRDARTLQKMAKSGTLHGDFRDLRSNAPLAQQINQAKQQLVAMNMAYSLDIDPSTSEKELHAGFGSGFGSAVDALTYAVSGEKIFDNIEGYGKDELAESFVGALEQDGITIPQSAADRIDKSMGELTRDITMPLIPLVAEILIFKKAGGKQIGNLIDNVADLIKYESRLVRNSPRIQGLVSTVVGGTVKKGTRYQHVMQASAAKEMTYLAGADLIGGSIYGRESIDPLFGASMGYGMGVVEKNMINSAAKRIPFFTPLMNMIGRQTIGRSNLLKGSWQTAKGAGIGTGIMSVSQGVVALKNYYFERDQHALLEEFDQLTDMDHIVATYLSMHILGLKGNKLYDNLSKDFNTIIRGDTPQYRAARKTLGLKKIKEPEVDLQEVALKDQEIDLQGVDAEGKPIKLITREGKPIKGSELGKAQESTLKEIDDAYNKKVEELKSDPQYKNDLKPGGEVVPGSKLEAELIKVAEAKLEVQRYNDIMLAKGIAKANQKASGSYQKYKNQLWSTTEAIKSNRQLNSDQIQFMSELDPTILGDMTGMERTQAARLVKEGTDIMKIADTSYGPKTGPGRKLTIETARNFVEKTKEIQHLEMLMKNDPTLAPQYKYIIERLKTERDTSLDLLNSKEEGSLYAKDLPRREKIIAEEQTFVEGAVEKIKEVAGEDAISFKPVESREELKTILKEQGKKNIDEILEMDAYFDPATNTLYTNKEVMVETEATSAATHELGHWFLRNSFKQRNPQTGKLEITPEGIELINEWKESLPLQQRRIIEKRIKDNYQYKKGRKGKIPQKDYYEELITSYIDAVRKGQWKISKKGLTHLMKGSNSAKALKKLGIDVSTPEGVQRFIESLAKSARKGKLSKELIEFAAEQKSTSKPKPKTTPKPKPESKLEKLYKEEVKVEVKPEGKEKVEVKEEVEEIVEEKPEPVADKRTYNSPKELIKDLEITDKNALKEIKAAEEGAIGNRHELIDITTDSKGNRTATMMVGSTTLKDIPISSVNVPKPKGEPVASKTKQFTAKEQSKIISEAIGAKEKMIEANKLLVSQARVGYQDKAKKNAAAFKKKYGEVLNPTRSRGESNILGVDIVRAKAENLVGERIPADIAEAFNKSKYVSKLGDPPLKANEVIKNEREAKRTQLGAEELLMKVNEKHINAAKRIWKDEPNARVTKAEWNEMVESLFKSVDPTEHSILHGKLKEKGREQESVFDPSKSGLGTYLQNFFVKKAQGLLKTGEYIEAGERFRKEVKEDMLTTTTDISEAEVPTASMREEGLKMDPKETKVLESKVTNWINKNLKSLFGEKFTGGVGKVVDRFLSTGLRKFAREEITPIVDKRIPQAKIRPKGEGWKVNPKYEKFLEENSYPQFMKLMDTQLGSDGLIKGDPYVFVSPGGEGYKGFLYKQRGVTESGAPKRVKTGKAKEDVAYDWAGSKDFPLPTKEQFVDWHLRRKEYADLPSRPNELRRGMLNIMTETAVKDLMPKNLKKGSEALKGMSEEQFQVLELATKIEEVTNKILRNPDLVGHKSISEKKRQKMFDEVMNEITHPGTVEFVADMKTFNNLYPLEFDQFLNVQKRGLSLDSFLNKNPHVQKFFRMPIFEGEQAKLYQEKFEPSANTFKKAIKSSKDFPKEVKEKIGNLKPLGGTKDGKRYVNLKELKEFKDNLLSLSKDLPPKEKDLALGIIDAFLGEAYTTSQGSLRNNFFTKNGKVKLWYEKKLDGTLSKEPLNKKGKDGEYLPYEELRSVREQLKDWGENARKDKRYDHIKTKDIIGETSLRQRMGKVWRAPWGEKAKLARELFPESDAKAKQEMYMEWAKSQEKWLHEVKEGTKEFDSRLKTLARIAGHNTNLTAGMRQFLPTGYLYMPKKLQKYAKGRAKLEHLKPNLGQSIELLEAIYKGEVGARKEALLKDYTSFFAPEGRLAFLDVIGGETNMSNLSRLTGDLSILKDVYTRESGFTESVYDKMIREGAKELKLTKSQENAIKENFAADYTNMYLAKGDKASKLGMKQVLKPENAKQRKGVVKQNTENSIWGSKSQKPKSISDQVEKMVKADMALENGRKIDKPIKKARVFDFDDTVAKTKSNVLYELADGTKGKLTAEQFAKDGETLLQAGAKFDFSEFNKVMEGKKGPLFDLMKKMKEAAGERDLFILTARSQEAAPAIREFLKGLGVDIPVENITGLGNSTGEAKADWMIEKAAEGYNDFFFADDAIQNVKAVKKVLDQIDVKSKVQQVIASKSKDLNGEFNRIIEATTGVEWFKEFSPAKAEVLGKRKGKGKFFLPPGAEDFLGLIYPTIGKGKMGENQLKWYEENLLKPYSRATQSLSTERVNMMADFKRLKKELDVPKDLRKRTESGFTHEQALRVHLWNKQGMEVPGLSKKDLKELSEVVENNPKLKAFSEQLQMILKGDVYSTPKKHWLSGTITTDLIDLLNTTKRNKYLQEWNQNIDIIFSKPNLNKLESIYGKKYREALENTITRMKAGKNRTSTGNRVSDGVLDYINNAQGTIMFLNMRSAVLQTISAANFINLGFNNPYKAGKAFANQPQYWKDFVELMNSDYLVDRRNGLKLNISESEIADAAAGSTNKAKAAINYILEKGYIPTKFADSFAIASGGATWYRNRINDLIKKEKLSPEEAKKKAFEEFRDISEKSQQSSDPSKISQQQSSDLGRVVLQFVNTPMQYTRLQKRSFQDLKNGRGDWKTHVSKILYYGIMQNLWFNGMQQGLFALGFGDDEIDEREEKKLYDTANGMADSILRGLGMGGMTVSVLKNTVIDIYRRSQRKRPEYGDAWIKLLGFSPSIKNKMSKLRSAGWPFDSKKRRAEVWDKGFSLDNPAWESLAKVISATTNVPLDRLFSKYNNLQEVVAEDTEMWQGIAMFLGWPEWDIKPDED